MLLRDMKNYWTRYGFRVPRLSAVALDNLLTYFLNKKPTLGPMYVGWNLTFRCNCFCSFCQTHEFAGKESELTTEECLRITRELGQAKVVELSLTGGEPLIKTDIDKIIREGKRYGININIITNGALLERHAQMIVESGVDSVSISLDSLDPEEHNTIREHKGLYEKVQRGVQKIIELRGMKKGTKKKPRIIIGSTVNKKNYHGLDEFIGYWSQIADQVIIQPIHDGSPTSLFKISDDTLTFSPDDRKEFIKTHEALLKKYPLLNNTFEREFPEFFFAQRNLYKRYKCSAGFFMLQIDAYGHVYPCTENIWSIGNLKTKPFLDIWQGSKLGKVRKFIRDGKNKCMCWHRCTGPLNTALNSFVRPRK